MKTDGEHPDGEYRVGRGKPPLHTRFKKGQSGNPRGPRPKNLPALLVAALDEPVVVTTEGESRRITKREAVVAQLVDKSAGADWRATKMLLDILQDIEKRSGAAPPPEVSPLTAADAEVVENLLARLRRTEFATSPSKSPDRNEKLATSDLAVPAEAGTHGFAASKFFSDSRTLETFTGSCGGNDGPRLFAGEAEWTGLPTASCPASKIHHGDTEGGEEPQDLFSLSSVPLW